MWADELTQRKIALKRIKVKNFPGQRLWTAAAERQRRRRFGIGRKPEKGGDEEALRLRRNHVMSPHWTLPPHSAILLKPDENASSAFGHPPAALRLLFQRLSCYKNTRSPTTGRRIEHLPGHPAAALLRLTLRSRPNR